MAKYGKSASYGRERYYWLKAHGICVQCGQADAEPGRTKCPACRERHRQQCHKYAAAHADELRQKRKKWFDTHPDYMREYLRQYRQINQGAGQLVTNRKPKIHKPDGTCRRRGCWESAQPFSCWCRGHLDEMRERRWMNDYLRRIASASTAKCSPRNGW